MVSFVLLPLTLFVRVLTQFAREVKNDEPRVRRAFARFGDSKKRVRCGIDN